MLRLRGLRLEDERRLLCADDEAEEPLRAPNVVIIRFFFVGFFKKLRLNVGNFMVTMQVHEYNIWIQSRQIVPLDCCLDEISIHQKKGGVL